MLKHLKNVIPYQAVLREILEKFLPDDAHIRCNGRVRGKCRLTFVRAS